MRNIVLFTLIRSFIGNYRALTMLFFICFTPIVLAQTGLGTANPSGSALLDVHSTTKGFLTPRMTSLQRSAIVNPATGLFIYNLDLHCFEYYNGADWSNICNISSDSIVPTNVNATATDGGAVISFEVPTSNTPGFYAIYSGTGELLATGNQSPITISGLSNGVPNFFSVVSISANGISQSSELSSSIIPGPAPSAPVKFALKPGDGSALLNWQVPTSGGSVSSYIVQQRSPLNGLPDWVNIATLNANTTQYLATGLKNGNVNLYISPEYHFRVKAVNGAGESTSIVLKTIPLKSSTVLMHDNFNQVPVSAKWDQFLSSGVFAAAGGATSHMYGEPDGTWKLPPANNGSSAKTILSFSNTNKTVDIQFDWYIDPFNTNNGWGHRMGLVEVNSSNKFEVYLNNGINNHTTFTNFNGPINGGTNYPFAWGAPEEKIIHVRIVLNKDGGLRIYTNGGLRQFWSSSQIPNMFTNIKFFAHSTGTWHQSQFIDNFTVSEY